MNEARSTATAPDPETLEAHQGVLLRLAEQAIDHGLEGNHPPAVDVATYPPALQEPRSAFASLFDERGELRGCTGSIEPRLPLALEVSLNAFNAAFRDPRFPPLAPSERLGITCKLSVLSPLEPLPFTSEAELIRRLRPHTDGLVLESQQGQGTLLPAVWAHLPDPTEFFLALKRKAGLPLEGLPPDTRVFRYETVTVG